MRGRTLSTSPAKGMTLSEVPSTIRQSAAGMSRHSALLNACNSPERKPTRRSAAHRTGGSSGRGSGKFAWECAWPWGQRQGQRQVCMGVCMAMGECGADLRERFAEEDNVGLHQPTRPSPQRRPAPLAIPTHQDRLLNLLHLPHAAWRQRHGVAQPWAQRRSSKPASSPVSLSRPNAVYSTTVATARLWPWL